LLQDEWIQIAPVGDHPHEQGIQRLDGVSIANMAKRFNSLASRVGRVFSGVPLFEGHHDTDPEKYPNGKSFAWVMELQDRAGEGLWGKLKWTNEGRDLVTSGNYKFVSPVWTAREVGQENGRTVYRPEALVSLALTNLPNLPLLPLANEKTTKGNLKTLIEILELKAEASGEEICAAAETLSNARRTEGERAVMLANQLAAETNRANAERAARIELVLANAVLGKRMTLAEKDHWRGELEKDFAVAEEALGKRRPVLNGESQTRALGNERGQYETPAARSLAIKIHMDQKRAQGVKQEDAWAQTRVELAPVFEMMEGAGAGAGKA